MRRHLLVYLNISQAKTSNQAYSNNKCNRRKATWRYSYIVNASAVMESWKNKQMNSKTKLMIN